MQFDLLKIAEFIGACSLILSVIIGGYKLYDKLTDDVKELKKEVDQNEKKHEQEMAKLKEDHAKDINNLRKEINHVKEESFVIVQGLNGCLDGLLQLKCNGEVTKSKRILDEYICKAAHDQWPKGDSDDF